MGVEETPTRVGLQGDDIGGFFGVTSIFCVVIVGAYGSNWIILGDSYLC